MIEVARAYVAFREAEGVESILEAGRALQNAIKADLDAHEGEDYIDLRSFYFTLLA